MNIEEVLNEIEKEAKEKGLPIIGRIKGKVLAELVKRHMVKTALEIGTLIGYSALIISSNLKGKGKLITLEINEDSARKAMENFRKAGLEKKIEVITGDAKKTIPSLDYKFDMVFIDAEKREYLTYLKLVEPKLKRGAIIVADNVKMFEESVKDFLNYVRNSGKYKSASIDLGYDAMEISIKLE